MPRDWLSWFKRVGEFFRKIRRMILRRDEGLAFGPKKRQMPRFQEKPLSYRHMRIVPKPTQVDELRILRRLRELG